MASTMADKDGTKLKNSSNPSRMRVRIVGKIRGFTDQESGLSSKPWIVFRKSPDLYASQKVTISFADQSTSRKVGYELDYCYEQDEENSLIYSREIEPFIPEVFDGRIMSIIAYGARGSGKTSTIQGMEEKPGLAVMTMAELLSKAEGNGDLVSISIYEVCHDHVFDLLDVKRPEIQVLEAQGTINLKGLSKVPVKSIQEFCDIYFGKSSSQKAGSNISLEPRKMSHKGLIIYISSIDGNKNCKLVGKMNFVDLAGYEDSRRCIKDGTTVVESARINKSLYALLNVVHALNAHENRMPYRESKLTHMLKESLAGKSRVLMLTCMNPSFCQDTIHTVSLASRSCQSNAQSLTDSNAGSQSASKLDEFSSTRSRKPPFFSAKKQIGSGLQFSEKKVNSISKGRKLFDVEKTITSEQPKFPLLDTSACESKVLPCNPSTITSLQEEVPKDKFTNSSPRGSKEDELDTSKDPTSIPLVDVSPNNELPDVTPIAVNNSKDMILYQDESMVGTTGKENICVQIHGKGSPPLSEKIRKISENLKALCSSTPFSLRIPEEMYPSGTDQVGCGDIVEPKTPVMEHDMKANDRSEIVKYNSPWESFNQRSTGMKHTLIQEYLKILNSASKEELKGLKGIGEKRATYILELREESPEPFKRLEDLENIGLSAKQIKGMMRKAAGDLFN